MLRFILVMDIRWEKFPESINIKNIIFENICTFARIAAYIFNYVHF